MPRLLLNFIVLMMMPAVGSHHVEKPVKLFNSSSGALQNFAATSASKKPRYHVWNQQVAQHSCRDAPSGAEWRTACLIRKGIRLPVARRPEVTYDSNTRIGYVYHFSEH